MKLIIGLGNPGKEYEYTRHNIGFFFLDKYLEKMNIMTKKMKFNGIYFEHIINGEKIIFLKPQSYMNLSGVVVKKYVDYFKIDICDIFVISDDLSLSIGNYRLRSSGSSGGHNGLKNIENCLLSTNFKRLKIGISDGSKYNVRDYVLGKFSKQELMLYDDMIEVITDIINDFLAMDFEKLMCKYNRKNR